MLEDQQGNGGCGEEDIRYLNEDEYFARLDRQTEDGFVTKGFVRRAIRGCGYPTGGYKTYPVLPRPTEVQG